MSSDSPAAALAAPWSAVRAQFPATEGQVFLDTATWGPPPRAVAEAVERAHEAWARGRGDWRAWDAEGERAREGFARWIGRASSEVALMSSLSAAAGQVAACLPYEPGDNLVLGDYEFRSLGWPFLAQQRRGFELREVPFREGRLVPEELCAAIDERTRLVAVSVVQSSSGHRMPLEPLVEACRANGARLFVDGTQAVGALRVPLEGVDYLGLAAYKWLLCPRGTAFLWAAPERAHELTPLAPSWKTPDDPHAAYYGGPYAPAPRASALDASLPWSVWVGAGAALEWMNQFEPEAVEARVLELAQRFRQGAYERGCTALYPEQESSQIVGLRVPDPEGVRARLADAQVRAAVRGPFLRVSFHLFNDESDVDAALRALEGA